LLLFDAPYIESIKIYLSFILQSVVDSYSQLFSEAVIQSETIQAEPSVIQSPLIQAEPAVIQSTPSFIKAALKDPNVRRVPIIFLKAFCIGSLIGVYKIFPEVLPYEGILITGIINIIYWFF